MVAGFAVLAALLCWLRFCCFRPYFENWKFQQYLNDLSADAGTSTKSPEVVRANVVDKAGQLGLPVHSDDVRVTRDGQALRVEVLYLVRVNLGLYSVDLHFRPAS